jgi:hypothetical protein
MTHLVNDKSKAPYIRLNSDVVVLPLENGDLVRDRRVWADLTIICNSKQSSVVRMKKKTDFKNGIYGKQIIGDEYGRKHIVNFGSMVAINKLIQKKKKK